MKVRIEKTTDGKEVQFLWPETPEELARLTKRKSVSQKNSFGDFRKKGGK